MGLPQNATAPPPTKDGSSPQLSTTLNGTAVVDRMALAILENLGGDVPDVLVPYGAPERVER